MRQVCSLVWSGEFKEIMSGHGFSYNQLTIWKYPQMTKVVDLTGKSDRSKGGKGSNRNIIPRARLKDTA